MENPTAFDLNESVRNWRRKLAASPAFRAADLEELEGHLRDSVRALEATGLSADEAFLVASRRVGPPETLGNEFAKLNLESVWLNRALWMLTGWLAIDLFATISSGVATASAVGWQSLHVSGEVSGALQVVINLAIFAALLRWIWLSGKRPNSLLWRVANWFKTRPMAVGVCVFGLLVAEHVFRIVPSVLEARFINRQHAVSVSWSALAAAILTLLVWPLAFGWLAKRNRTTAGQ